MILINNIKYLKSYALANYPQEICGFVIDNEFIPCTNTAEDPINSFVISNKEYKKYSNDIQALIHSHTLSTFKVDGRVPSKKDMQVAESLNIPSGILHTNGTAVTSVLWFTETYEVPILARPYIPNVYDCYTLLRDYLYNIDSKHVLPILPRDENWIETDPEFIEVNKLKFSTVVDSPKIGDIVILKIGNQFENHLGIVTSENSFSHHLADRFSTEDSLSLWYRQIVEIRRCNKINSI